MNLFHRQKKIGSLCHVIVLCVYSIPQANAINFFPSPLGQPHPPPQSFICPIMQSNQQPEEEEECSICLDDLRKYGSSKIERATCCGKGMHDKCREGVLVSSTSDKQKKHCVMCRTEYPGSAEEGIEQLRPWVEKGKAWAQVMLASRYAHGVGVDQSYQQARELYE